MKSIGLKKADVKESEEEEFLGSWFCNQINVNRRKCLVFCNSISLYCFFIHGVLKKDLSNTSELFRKNLAANLEFEGINAVVLDQLMPEYEQLKYAKTNSRSVLGSMNDYCHLFKCYSENEVLDPARVLEINQRLNEVPMSAIDYSSGIKEVKRQLMGIAT